MSSVVDVDGADVVDGDVDVGPCARHDCWTSRRMLRRTHRILMVVPVGPPSVKRSMGPLICTNRITILKFSLY